MYAFIMSLARYFASSKKSDLSSKQFEARDDTKKRQKIAQLQVSQRMMMFFLEGLKSDDSRAF